MPSSPSAAETAPSCMTPAPERSGSSSWRAIGRPARRWYCRALRRMRALRIGRPSSESATAPAAASSFMSVSSSPRIPRVTVARKPMPTLASTSARSRRATTSAAVSTGGSVLAIARIPQKPPAAAALEPVSMSSLCSWPGVRRCTCGSKKAG
jgi:hypothetical protein